MTTTTHNQQNWFDVAMEHFGTAEMAFDTAVANGMSLTDVPLPAVVILPDGERNEYVVRLLAQRIPATGADVEMTVLEGIGYWYVERDFKVS